VKTFSLKKRASFEPTQPLKAQGFIPVSRP
jgi:hypothetical protein